MKQLSIFCLLFIINTYGQNKKTGVADFDVYLNSKATKNNTLASKTITFKRFVKDTLYNGESFRKYECTTFTDWKTPQSVTFVYELHNAKKYIRLDNKLVCIHKIDFGIRKQDNILFGIQSSIWGSYEPTEDSYYNRILGKEYVDAFDFKKKKDWNFYHTGRGMHLQFSNSRHTVVSERHDSVYTEKMATNSEVRLNDFFNRSKSVRLSPKLQKGDAIQLQYKKVTYKDSLRNFKSDLESQVDIVFVKDTILSGYKAMVFSVSEYNHEFKQELPDGLSITVFTDEGKMQNERRFGNGRIEGIDIEDKIYTNDASVKNNHVLVQNITEIKIGDTNFPMIVHYPSLRYILPFFPMSVTLEKNEKLEISYLKLGKKILGKKIPYPYREATYFRNVEQIAEDEIEVSFYVHINSTVKIDLREGKNSEPLFLKALTKGKYTLRLKTTPLKPANGKKKISLEYTATGAHGIEEIEFDCKPADPEIIVAPASEH